MMLSLQLGTCSEDVSWGQGGGCTEDATRRTSVCLVCDEVPWAVRQGLKRRKEYIYKAFEKGFTGDRLRRLRNRSRKLYKRTENRKEKKGNRIIKEPWRISLLKVSDTWKNTNGENAGIERKICKSHRRSKYYLIGVRETHQLPL